MQGSQTDRPVNGMNVALEVTSHVDEEHDDYPPGKKDEAYQVGTVA